MELHDRVVLITGASRGIGEALARAYAGEGARVALAARSRQPLEALAASLPRGRALQVPTDVTDRRQCLELVDRVLQRFGRVDILVNNAGVGMFAEIADTDLEQCRRLFLLNVFAPLQLTQIVLPQMKYRREGQIVNICSVVGHVAMPAMGAYSASKFALRALTDSLRLELKPFGIHVLGVYPGTVRTRFRANAYWGEAPRQFHSKRGSISAERCARAIVKASREQKREIVVPVALHGFIGLYRWFPNLIDKVLLRLFQPAPKPI